MGKMRYCERCGSPLTEDSYFCDNCGAAVPRQSGQNREEELFTPRRPGGSTGARRARERQAAPGSAMSRERSGPGETQGNPRRAGTGQREDVLRKNRSEDPVERADRVRKRGEGAGSRIYGSSYEGTRKTAGPDREKQGISPERRPRRPAPGAPGYDAPQGTPSRPPYRPQTGSSLGEKDWQGQEQRSRFRQEGLKDDWEQSWEREMSEEEERGFTPIQYILLAIMGVLAIALITFGIFWAVGRTKKSSQDRQNSVVTEQRQEETVKNENGGDDVITILDENGQTEGQTTEAPAAGQTSNTQPQTEAGTETQSPAERQTEKLIEGQPETPAQTETQPQTAAQPETQAIEILDGTQNQPAASSGEYILPDSSSRLLTDGDVAGLSYDELQMAINEIYARHGRRFATPEIKNYFESKSWYAGTVDADHFDESVFSNIENQNIQFLVGKMG